MSEDITFTEYVKLSDLDRDYDEDTHPTLKQVHGYLRLSNILLTNKLGTGVADSNGGILLVGVMLTDIQIHNREFKDGMQQYEKSFRITADMMRIIMGEHFEETMFSFAPTGNFIG